jgi:hypothetical protein
MTSGPAIGPGFWTRFRETAAWWWGEGRGAHRPLGWWGRAVVMSDLGSARLAATGPQERACLEGEGFGDGRCLMPLAASEGEDGLQGQGPG